MRKDNYYLDTESGRLILPAELQRDVDSILTAYRAGREATDAFGRVCSWIDAQEDGWVFDNYQECMQAISPDALRDAFASLYDEDIRTSLGLDTREAINDSHRLSYLEDVMIPRLFEDGDLSSGFGRFKATSSDGFTAVLVNDTRGYSFSGIISKWMGPYTTFDEFLDGLVKEGWALLDGRGFLELSTDAKLRFLRA